MSVPLFKLANALLFALSAVPIYLLARRVLSPWWSLGVTALSVTIPSSLYTSLVLTESTSYLAASAGVLAVVVTLECPTVARQVGLVAVITVAFATRAQFAALVPRSWSARFCCGLSMWNVRGFVWRPHAFGRRSSPSRSARSGCSRASRRPARRSRSAVTATSGGGTTLSRLHASSSTTSRCGSCTSSSCRSSSLPWC